MEPVQVIEGIVPLRMNSDNIFMYGESWARFHSKYPSYGFEEIWAAHICQYERCNAKGKLFWESLRDDPGKWAKLAVDKARCRANQREGVDASLVLGLLEPKPEPEDAGPLCAGLTYHVK